MCARTTGYEVNCWTSEHQKIALCSNIIWDFAGDINATVQTIIYNCKIAMDTLRSREDKVGTLSYCCNTPASFEQLIVFTEARIEVIREYTEEMIKAIQGFVYHPEIYSSQFSSGSTHNDGWQPGQQSRQATTRGQECALNSTQANEADERKTIQCKLHDDREFRGNFHDVLAAPSSPLSENDDNNNRHE